MNKQQHIESIQAGSWLLIGSGESYQGEIVSGPQLMDKIYEALYGDVKGGGDEERKFYLDLIEDPDNWCSDGDFGPTHWETDVGETDHLTIYRVTDKYSHGAELIAYERARQINDEDYNARHDDELLDKDLIFGAMAYCEFSTGSSRNVAVMSWPWDGDGFKPVSDPVRNLVKAGALIAAEIDRLQRAQAKASAK